MHDDLLEGIYFISWYVTKENNAKIYSLCLILLDEFLEFI